MHPRRDLRDTGPRYSRLSWITIPVRAVRAVRAGTPADLQPLLTTTHDVLDRRAAHRCARLVAGTMTGMSAEPDAAGSRPPGASSSPVSGAFNFRLTTRLVD